MPREDAQLIGAKRAYRNAKEEGNHQEEARWANVIGDIYKNRGEYVNALKWLRVDYEVSVKYLPERHVITTCQSLGEVYLRLHEFKEALVYQKKHLELAEDSNDLIEKQRANTQLGRTYHEMFSKSEDDHSSVRNAKKYFRKAMQLAQILKENPPSNNSSLLKEYIDAHNNIGMLEMDLDNLGEAKKFLTKGLEICDEEEVSENDDGRSRLNHNLGYVYMELRMWEEASEHIEKDIIICKNIGHCQGEAKGYINLGELHYRVQKYEEAIKCYRKALDLAKSMEDEDALVDQINQNINTVNEAMQVMDDLKKEEQNLKKLNRKVVISSGKSGERKCLLLQNASLDRLIEKASIIMAWQKHRDYSKKKKTIASQLCDKEKLGDSYVNIGESYEKLRMFDKSLKWYTKSWEIYKSVGNLEGQAMAKINIGNILDSDGHWARAFNAFEEGHRIAAQAKLPRVQLMALENMHYSQMIRFDKIEEARRLQLEIDFLKSKGEYGMQDRAEDYCSESDTGEEDNISLNRSSACSSPRLSNFNSMNSKDFLSVEELNDDAPLISLIRPSKNKPKLQASQDNEPNISTKPTKTSPNAMSKSTSTQQTVVSRKRVRLVLSDDEDEVCDLNCSKGRLREVSVEDVATSDECAVKESPDAVLTANGFKDLSGVTSKCAVSSTPVTLEESTCSYKSKSPRVTSQNEKDFISSSTKEVAFDHNMVINCDVAASSYFKSPISDDEYGQCVTFKIDNDLIHVDAGLCMVSDSLSIESLKVEVACLYYLRLPMEKRSRGLLPIIQHMKYGGRPLQSLEATETLKNIGQKEWIEVTIDGWVQKRLMKLYVDCCKELSEAPNLKLLKKLYNLEVSEDEVIVSDCDLQDVSIVPLLNALQAHKTIAMLDLSHNLLGNGTMEKLQQVLMSSSQKYGGFTLDLHCNRFGPTALFQICESPVLFARLEVLNISGNRLTDACGSYLKTILENCKALYNLNIERCSITSRTIQKIADSLNAESALSQLSLGYNNPVSGNAIVNLATKLAMLKRFSELNLNGIKLSNPAVDSLCKLAHASCLLGLMVGGSSIGTDGALKLTESLIKGAEELVKLDLSYCGLTSPYIVKINTDFSLVSGILELNLGGNPLMKEGGSALALAMKNPQCSLKVLVLNKCQLGLVAVIQILQALAENHSLEELNLADNVDFDKDHTLVCDLAVNINISNTPPNECPPTEDEDIIENVCSLNNEELEVADSEDEQIREPAMSRFDGSCVRSSRMNSSLSNCHFTRDLSRAIDCVKELKVLDLSGNGFSVQVAERLFSAWSLSSSRAAVAEKHIKDPIIHFSVQGVQCCGLKPCCKRD